MTVHNFSTRYNTEVTEQFW